MPDIPELLEGYEWTMQSTFDWVPESIYFGTMSTNGWPTVNKAIFVPIGLEEVCNVQLMTYGSSSGSPGSVDLGIYRMDGTRIVSSGLFAPAAVSGMKTLDIADTILQPGYYYLAMATSNTSNSMSSAAPNAAFLETFGVKEMLSATPLPPTATFSKPTSNYFPYLGIHFKTLV